MAPMAVESYGFGGGADAAGDMAFEEEMMAEDSVSSESFNSAGVAAAPIERLIIREGNITLEVEDTRATRDAIEALVASLADKGAFIISGNEYGGEDENIPYINIVIRVPVDEFDNVMDEIDGMALDVLERSEFGEDVTEQYVDLQARIESMEAARDRLLDIMRNADTTEDLLFAEQQLTQREVEIEALKGRLQYLGEAASLSRITVNLQPYILSQPRDDSWMPLETVRRAVDALIESLQDFADFLIVFGIAFLPWLAIIGLVVWAVVRWSRGRKAKKEVKSE
jgi:hypothetical protein